MTPPRLLLLAALAGVVHGKDVIVATEKGLLVDNEEGVTLVLEYENRTAISGHRTVPLAADSINSRVFYSLPQISQSGRSITGLMYVNIRQGVSPKPQPVMMLFADKAVSHVRGLAYDKERGILYWTNTKDRSIWRCTVTGGCRDTAQLKRLPKRTQPAAIAVDPCRGYLFWTDNNYTSPSVNRITVSSRTSSAIVRGGLFMPSGVAVDTSGQGRIYWADDSEGDHYKIESADLDGENRTVEWSGYYQMPMDLAFLPPSAERPEGALYWSDWTSGAVWTLDLNDRRKGPSKLSYRGGYRDRPMGVVPKDSIQHDIRCL